MYAQAKTQQGGAPGDGGATGGATGGQGKKGGKDDDDVVDADFEEVK